MNVVNSFRSLTCSGRTFLRYWALPLRTARNYNLRLSRNLRRIEQEAFLRCASLWRGLHSTIPATHSKACLGCAQLRAFCKTGKSTTWTGTYARVNAFDKCEHLDKPEWLRFLPPNDKDKWREDFTEAVHKGYLLLSHTGSALRVLLLLFDDQTESLLRPHHLQFCEPTGMRALAPRSW